MYVYIASRYSRKEEMKSVRLEIERIGLFSTSTWLEEPHAPNTQMSELTPEQHSEYANVDLQDINRCDFMLFFSESDLTPRGGRHVEFGYATGMNKHIHVIGPRENIFHYLDNVTVHADLASFISYVTKEVEDLI